MFAYPVFLMKALCFALFACAFNLLIGYVGLLSFGHALFFGWASYVCAHAAKVWGFPPELAIASGTVAAAGLGMIVGALAIRRQGIYFAMITLALAQMMYFFAIQAPFTHGEDGIQAVPRGTLFGFIDLADQTNMYITVLVIFLGCFLLIYRIINSPFGEVLKAIRRMNRAQFRSATEASATSSWPSRSRRHLLASRGQRALVFQLASLTDVDWPMSGEVILMTLVGGLGTLFGPVVGAFFMVTVENYLTTIGQWVFVVQGVIFVVCVLLFRRGIIGELARQLRIKL
jgi:branched-chain amino acid transport system permease protein